MSDPFFNLIRVIPAEGAVNTFPNAAQAIYVQNLCLWQGNIPLFYNLSWSLPPQRWTCLMGQSGIGKTTLLRLIAGLSSPDTRFEGSISQQKNIVYMGQNDALLPWLNVFDNAALSSHLSPCSPLEKKQIKNRVAHLLRKAGLESAAKLYPRELSGGMRQRVALVRALAQNQPIILMDEPFSRLDAITRHQLQNLAAELLKDKTVLLVTHDPQEALRLGDRIDLLSNRPACIETIATFSTRGPRELNSIDLIQLQKKLYEALSNNYWNGKSLSVVACA